MQNYLWTKIADNLKNQLKLFDSLRKERHFSHTVAVFGTWQPSKPAFNSLSTQLKDSRSGIWIPPKQCFPESTEQRHRSQPRTFHHLGTRFSPTAINQTKESETNEDSESIRQFRTIADQPEFQKNGRFTQQNQTKTKRR